MLDRKALLFAPCEASEEHAESLRSPVLRVWLPSRRCPLSRSARVSFNSQRSGGSPFRAFLLSGGRISVSQDPSTLALPKKTQQPFSCASVASSHRKSRVPSALSEGLIRSGTSCSPRVSRLPGPPPVLSRRRASPSSPSPLALRIQKPYDPRTPEPQGFPSNTGRPFPPKGAPSCLAFPTDDPVPPLRKISRCGLFFPLEAPKPLTKPQPLLFASKDLPPIGRWHPRFGAPCGEIGRAHV